MYFAEHILILCHCCLSGIVIERTNVFASFVNGSSGDYGNISGDTDIPDEEEWLPAQDETVRPDTSEINDDDDTSVYTELVPLHKTEAVVGEHCAVQASETCLETSSARIIFGKDKVTQ